MFPNNKYLQRDNFKNPSGTRTVMKEKINVINKLDGPDYLFTCFNSFAFYNQQQKRSFFN